MGVKITLNETGVRPKGFMPQYSFDKINWVDYNGGEIDAPEDTGMIYARIISIKPISPEKVKATTKRHKKQIKQLQSANSELLAALKAAAINPNQQIVSETILKYTK
jgi:hypothetical protein